MDQNGTQAAIGISVLVIPMMTVGHILVGLAIGLVLFYFIRWGASKAEPFCKEVNAEAKKLYQQMRKEEVAKVD